MTPWFDGYGLCCRTVATDVAAVTYRSCPTCGRRLRRCEQCAGLVTPTGFCAGCVRPLAQIAAGSVMAGEQGVIRLDLGNGGRVPFTICECTYRFSGEGVERRVVGLNAGRLQPGESTREILDGFTPERGGEYVVTLGLVIGTERGDRFGFVGEHVLPRVLEAPVAPMVNVGGSLGTGAMVYVNAPTKPQAVLASQPVWADLVLRRTVGTELPHVGYEGGPPDRQRQLVTSETRLVVPHFETGNAESCCLGDYPQGVVLGRERPTPDRGVQMCLRLYPRSEANDVVTAAVSSKHWRIKAVGGVLQLTVLGKAGSLIDGVVRGLNETVTLRPRSRLAPVAAFAARWQYELRLVGVTNSMVTVAQLVRVV